MVMGKFWWLVSFGCSLVDGMDGLSIKRKIVLVNGMHNIGMVYDTCRILKYLNLWSIVKQLH